MKKLTAMEVGKPIFPTNHAQAGSSNIFDLSSHCRAREALEFALSLDDPRFNVFVLGEEQSGRLTNTHQFVKKIAKTLSSPGDWIYLYNFHKPTEPLPFLLPTGKGRQIREALKILISHLRETIRDAINNEKFNAKVESENRALSDNLEGRLNNLREQARENGLDLIQTENGQIIVAIDASGQPVPSDSVSDSQRALLADFGPQLSEELKDITRESAALRLELQTRVNGLAREVVDQATATIVDQFESNFGEIPVLKRWIVELRADIIQNFNRFLPRRENEHSEPRGRTLRYTANLLVDNFDINSAPVVIEPNPTYENLFGRLEYYQSERTFETDFTLIKSGSLHRANGGILILRAEAVANNRGVWEFLKSALRDQEIRIEEPHRSGGLPVAGAPKPAPIPLSIRVILVGSPHWYYSVFAHDPEFKNYFKVKADIDPDFEATAADCDVYRSIIQARAHQLGCAEITPDALDYLLGIAARWAGDRYKISSQCERLEEVIIEANGLRQVEKSIAKKDIAGAVGNRRRRNARLEDRTNESLINGTIKITTSGWVVGQVNGLTVRNTGDHSFGSPTRITARASAGRDGITNIERDTELGGPIQQKGVLILQGFLSGIFARQYPLSFNCSITFEQNYGGVEGDSASLAELLAILSDLSGVPLRQDLAITGSVNQRGEAQAIGGANHKIEGFFRTCKAAGELTGEQGVVIPFSNERNLILRDEVIEAIRAETFHIYSVKTIEEAILLFTGLEAIGDGKTERFSPNSVYGRVSKQLDLFDKMLSQGGQRI
jgi:predicted ATP-dependent protease